MYRLEGRRDRAEVAARRARLRTAARPDFCALRTLVSYRCAKHLRDAREDIRTRAGITCIECGREKPFSHRTLSHTLRINSRIGSIRDSAHDTDSTCTLDDTCELLAYDPRVDAARLPERHDIVARDRGEPASRELVARERIEDRA